MMDVAAEEHALWQGGANRFREVMADDGCLVTPQPGGIMDRASALAMLAGAPQPDAVTFTDVIETAIAPGTTAFTYRTDAKYGGMSLIVFCTSIWRSDGGTPQLALHQQTPSPESEL